MFWFWLPPATKAPRGRPSPHRGVEENGKKKAEKLVGWDKGSLTEQQTKGNRNNNDTDKEKRHELHEPQSHSPEHDQRRALPSCE